MKLFCIIFLCIVLIFILRFLCGYIYLTFMYKLVQRNFSDVNVLLKERYKLIPHILNQAKKSKTVQEITKYHAELVNLDLDVKNIDRKIALDDELEKDVKELISTMDINDTQIASILNSYSEIEKKINDKKIKYNKTAQYLKNATECFPSSFIARFMNIKYFDFFTM